jgi:hypothetical protein
MVDVFHVMIATGLLGIAMEQTARSIALPDGRQRATRSVVAIVATVTFVWVYVV